MRGALSSVIVVVVAIAMGGLGIAGPSPSTADRLLQPYYVIHKSLSADSIAGIAAAGADMAKAGRQAAKTEVRGKAELLAIADSAATLNAKDIKDARNGFGELTQRLITYLKISGAGTNPPFQFYCSMVKKHWLQPDKEVRNPYYGASMPKCGELVKTGNEPSGEQPSGHHH